MKKLRAGLVGAVVLCASLLSASTPTFALGGCGPNEHRNGAGRCVAGGQNEDWCLKRTGHAAVRTANGTMRCVR